ncbi:MAG TPA: MarR family winged helix-turn-helix transcriptional regulator [Pseudonocardia sp.]|jgi:DNA-binding MarR family transcriptional regulator
MTGPRAARSVNGSPNPGALPDFHTAPGHLFRRGRQLHDALWVEHVSDELTPLQYAVLTALELEPNIDQRTLGERIALDKSTVGDIATRLHGRGLIARHTDPQDSRRNLLSLTVTGRTVLLQAAPGVERIGQEILNALTPDERTELLRLLNKLLYAHQAVPAEPRKRSARG